MAGRGGAHASARAKQKRKEQKKSLEQFHKYKAQAKANKQAKVKYDQTHVRPKLESDRKSAYKVNSDLPAKPSRQDGFYDHHEEVLADRQKIKEMDGSDRSYQYQDVDGDDWEDVTMFSDSTQTTQPQDLSSDLELTTVQKVAQNFKNLKTRLSTLF